MRVITIIMVLAVVKSERHVSSLSSIAFLYILIVYFDAYFTCTGHRQAHDPNNKYSKSESRSARRRAKNSNNNDDEGDEDDDESASSSIGDTDDEEDDNDNVVRGTANLSVSDVPMESGFEKLNGVNRKTIESRRMDIDDEDETDDDATGVANNSAAGIGLPSMPFDYENMTSQIIDLRKDLDRERRLRLRLEEETRRRKMDGPICVECTKKMRTTSANNAAMLALAAVDRQNSVSSSKQARGSSHASSSGGGPNATMSSQKNGGRMSGRIGNNNNSHQVASAASSAHPSPVPPAPFVSGHDHTVSEQTLIVGHEQQHGVDMSNQVKTEPYRMTTTNTVDGSQQLVAAAAVAAGVSPSPSQIQLVASQHFHPSVSVMKRY